MKVGFAGIALAASVSQERERERGRAVWLKFLNLAKLLAVEYPWIQFAAYVIDLRTFGRKEGRE